MKKRKYTSILVVVLLIIGSFNLVYAENNKEEYLQNYNIHEIDIGIQSHEENNLYDISYERVNNDDIIGNYLQGNVVAKAKDMVYMIYNNLTIKKYTSDLSKSEEILNTAGAKRIYSYNDNIYFLVNDGIKLLSDDGNHKYIYKSENIESSYCQLYNGRFYFVENGIYEEVGIGTDGPTIDIVKKNALKSINIFGEDKKTYYYIDISAINTDIDISISDGDIIFNGATIEIGINASRKVIDIDTKSKFIIAENKLYYKNKIYSLRSSKPYMTVLLNDFSNVIGYSNGDFYSSKNTEVHRISLAGIREKIQSDDSYIHQVFDYKENTYGINMVSNDLYRIDNNKIIELGYLTDVKQVYTFEDEAYSTSDKFGLMKINLGGNELNDENEDDKINANNSLSVRNFSYDNENIYLSNGKSVYKYDKEVNKKEEVLSGENINDIQVYNGKIIYHNNKSINIVNENNKEQTLYTSDYTIHKIQKVNKYIYFEESILLTGSNYYNSRVGRIDINNNKVEFFISDIMNHNKVNFVVIDNKIYYGHRNNSDDIFIYDISTGISKKINYSGYFSDIRCIYNGKIYARKTGEFFVINSETGEKIREEKVFLNNIFDFNGRIYGTSSESLYEIGESIKELGYITGLKNIVKTNKYIYSTSDKFGLMKINLGGNELNDENEDDKINANNSLSVRNFSYDNENIYLSNGKSVYKYDKEVNKKEEVLSGENINDIQVYNGKIIYHNNKSINIVNENNKEQTLYTSDYTIHKIQKVNKYIYFEESILLTGSNYYNSRVGRIDINNNKVEFFISDIMNHNKVNFVVIDNKIYYGHRNNSDDIFIYDISTGISKKINYSGYFGDIKAIYNGKIYILKNGEMYLINSKDGKLINKYMLGESFNRIILFKGKVYGISSDNSMYIIKNNFEEYVGKISVSSQLKTILVTADKCYYIDYDNKLFNIEIKLRKDINGDGVIDIFDLSLVSFLYNKMPNDSEWNSACDINNDGVIDIFDVVLISNEL